MDTDPTMTSRKGQLLDPLEKTVSNERRTLQDLKSLLEDRGYKRNVYDKDKSHRENVYDKDKSHREKARIQTCVSARFNKIRWCLSRFKTVLVIFLVLGLEPRICGARSSEPRYETAYACEGKTLKIGCAEGSVIHLIRANYGRFSITICNDHGNTDWSVNCMSTKSLRVLHSRCSMHHNCSILASTTMFGDPCPNTLKYLEAHYQCVPASTTSTTTRPSPPWLITSQPSVWRSTAPPTIKNPVQTQQNERKKPTVITPPTFRPHITLPPEVKLGDVGVKKTTTRPPDSSSERDPPQSPRDSIPDIKVDIPKIVEPEQIPKNEKPMKEDDSTVTEETMHWPAVKDEDSDTVVHQSSKENRPADTVIVDDFERSFTTIPTINLGRRAYCPQTNARGLHWNWTLANSYAVQPCPGGATGLARWKCTLIPHQYTEEDRPRRRATSLPSGENYHDLGLDQPTDRQLQLIRRLGSEALLKGREGYSAELKDYRSIGISEQLPSSLIPHGDDYIYNAIPEWHGLTPDLSECRSVWLNSLEARVREGESLLSISNDLAQVTSSKTLYGGDMTTTTTIMKKLATRMAQNVHTPDPQHREAMVTDMLLGVIKTGSNLLEDSQRLSWADLSREAQNRVASELLTQLEENAFLLADAVTKEKTILQIVKNICLSVRVLEVKNVEDETFPSLIAQEQWKASEDTITIPKAALLDNRQKDLVRIVFFAFDRLEEILPPTFGKTPHFAAYQSDTASSSTTSINSEREKRNITRVLNSKVISASLGNGRHIQLSQMVHLTMKHLKTENVTNPACVFWDYTLHGWSPEGCQVEWSNETHTGCACSHLTNFAILMDVHGVSLSPAHQLALQTITYIGCGISTVALAAALIVFMCFRNGKSDRSLIHMNLCACLLIAEITFIAGIDQTQNLIMCGIIAGILHYFFLAAFAWMFLEGLHLYAMLVEVFEPENPRGRWYCYCAYLAPAIVVAVSAAVNPNGYGTQHHCWLSTEKMFVMSFVGPVCLVLVANWACLGLVIYMMCKHSTVSLKAKDDAKRYKIRVWLNTSLVLAFLLGLTWTFGLLYLNDKSVVMAYAFTILNSLQGLVIFVFQCLQNDKFRNHCARVGRRHPWLSCCLHFTGQPSETLQPPPASSTNHLDARQPSVKSRRYHQSTADVDDVVDPRDVTNTSSKHHPGNSSTLPHHDTISRQLAPQNHLSPYECDQPIVPGSPRHMKDEESPLHHQGYQTTRSYNHDFRNPHVYMSQHSPGSQEMIFRKQYKDDRRKHHHHHGSQNVNHTYSEIAAQQGRIYRRGSEEFRVIQDDPVYEEIERNETLMSDMSDDNSGPDNCRQNPGHHGSSSSKFFGDHRPLISYSPGERHHHEEHYGKYGKWDALERYDPRHYESGRLMHPYHQPPENMRALAAVLNGENNVVCHLEPHTSYEGYQPQSGNPRTVSQPSF